jgi:outer membrane protein TolC
MKTRILFVAIAVLLGGQAFAQQKLSLTLQEAQAYALGHNRTLKNASLDVKKSEAGRWQTIATLLPQVNATVDYANMMGYQIALGGFDIAMPPSGTLAVTTSLTVSSAQIIGIQISDIAKKMTDISLKQTEQQIGDQVKTIYYSTLVMEETVRLLEKNLDNMNQMLRHTEQSVKVGIAGQIDADQIAVQVASMEATVSSTKRSLEMLYNSLRLQLGIDVNTEIVLTQTIQDLMNIDKALSLLVEEFVPDNNYNYQLLKQSTDLSKKQVEMKKWAYAPSISTFHQYSAKKYFSDEQTFNMTPPNMLGFSLNVPVFSSGNRYKALEAARIDYQKQLNTLADTEEALTIQHRQLLYNLTSAYESFETQKKNLEVIQRVLDNISRKYEQGIASSLEVTTTGTNLISAQSSYVRALMEVVSAQIALEELLNTDRK